MNQRRHQGLSFVPLWKMLKAILGMVGVAGTVRDGQVPAIENT